MPSNRLNRKNPERGKVMTHDGVLSFVQRNVLKIPFVNFMHFFSPTRN